MESASAYSIYKANKKKSTVKNKKKVKKLACSKAKLSMKNRSSSKLNKSKNNNNKNKKLSNKINKRNNNDDEEIGDHDVTALVEELMNPEKKLNKVEQKKKQKLEDYLIKQLEKDDNDENDYSDDDDSFYSDEDEEEEGEEEYSDDDMYSDEYTINGTSLSTSVTTTGSASFTSESSITDEQDEQAAQELVENILNRQKGNKRKCDTNNNKAAATTSLKVNGTNDASKSNGPIETKKPKLLNNNNKETAVPVTTVTTNKSKNAPRAKSNSSVPNGKTISNSQSGKTCPRYSQGATTTISTGAGAKVGTGAVAKAGTGAGANAARSRKSVGSVGTCPRPTITNKNSRNSIMNKTEVKLEPLSPVSNVLHMNSIEEGKRVFKWLLNPVKVEEFFSKYWETTACLIKRPNNRNYFQHLLSFKDLDQMLLKNHVEYTKNLDITLYKNGERLTMNPEGRALPPIVWDHYDRGCSIRLLNPQTFLNSFHALNAALQEYFHCMIGTNVYLTPPNSQGFAPHYDDIEAFVLQIEGRKLWKLYKPRNSSELLPRYSSRNFKQDEIGEPIMEEILEPGDLLYFPRGTIHQAKTLPDHHSLHVTLSVYQRQSYGDLFEKMLPVILKKSIQMQLDLRKGLPLNLWRNVGFVYNKVNTKERTDIQKKMKQLLNKIIRELPLTDIVDEAVDQMAKRFQHEAMPPEIHSSERKRTIFGSQSITNDTGECICDYNIEERTNIRLLRANIVRLVKEQDDEDRTIDKFHLYYYLDNSKEYCQYDMNFMEIEPLQAACVEVLIKSYPAYIGVAELPISDTDSKIQFATALWEKGLLMMEKPFA